MSENLNQKEPLPVDETLKVIDYDTIYRTKKWWCAVALVNAFGHDKVIVYLWQWKEVKKLEDGHWVPSGVSKWRVQQKMGINFEENWESIKKSVDKFLPRKGMVTA